MFPNVTILDTAPTVEPITLDDAKEQLRIDHSAHDIMIAGLIQAAREQVEAMCGRAIVQQTRIAYFEQFPTDEVFHLLYPEIRSITHIKYTNSAGTQTEYDSAKYSLDPGSEPGRVVRAYGQSWPSATMHYLDYPVEIKYVCGYAPDGTNYTTNVPERIKLVIKMLVESMYGGAPVDYSKYHDNAIHSLLNQYRVWRK